MGENKMGFKELLGSGLRSGYNAIKEKNEKILEYKSKLERYDDERLMKEFQRCSGEKRMACVFLLKDRGYTFRNDEWEKI